MSNEPRWWASRDAGQNSCDVWIGPNPPQQRYGFFEAESPTNPTYSARIDARLLEGAPECGECIEIEPLVIRRKGASDAE